MRTPVVMPSPKRNRWTFERLALGLWALAEVTLLPEVALRWML